MSTLKKCFSGITLAYHARNVKTLRRRIEVLADRLEVYVKRDDTTDSAMRVESAITTSRSIMNGMNLIPDSDKVVHLRSVVKSMKSLAKMNHC